MPDRPQLTVSESLGPHLRENQGRYKSDRSAGETITPRFVIAKEQNVENELPGWYFLARACRTGDERIARITTSFRFLF